MSVLILALLFVACKKEGTITVTTTSVTEITENGAQTGGDVFYTGGFSIGECGVCYSEHSYPSVNDDFDDNSYYTNDHYGTGTFTSSLNNLKSGTKYYVRAYARTSSGIIYGNEEVFYTKEGNWLYYGDNVMENSWGLINGGTLTWAVMFPSSMLTSYNNKKINKVKICVGKKGTYTVNIYKGGTSSPTTLLYTKNYSITSTGMNTLEVNPAINLTTSQNLWISITNSHEAGEYPAVNSKGINNPNARWRCHSGDWVNDTSNGWEDVCWMIQACLSNSTNKEEEVLDITPDQQSNSVISGTQKKESKKEYIGSNSQRNTSTHRVP